MSTNRNVRPIVNEGQPQFHAGALSLDLGPQEIHRAIHAIPVGGDDEQLTEIAISGSAGQDGVLMRLNHPIRITMEGPLGDYAFAYNAESDIRMTGDVGSGVAEGMVSGVGIAAAVCTIAYAMAWLYFIRNQIEKGGATTTIEVFM